ncbi:MAG TPA: cupredoxin family copper-binding protein [Patescibacteria group bacterium]|nr:cupredoxin family copper-binding protein [Patescibacteria group bacterium]
MKRNTPLIIIAAVIVLGVAATVAYSIASRQPSVNSEHQHAASDGSSTGDKNAEPAVKTNMVTISNFDYGPQTITVKKGTTVTWTNQDGVKHNVVGDTLSTLNGPLLAKGESYSYTFDTVGTFSYHCAPHPYMKGTVVVTD